MQEVLGCLLALRLSRPHSSRCTKSLLFCGMLSYRLRIETQPFDATVPKLAKTSESRGCQTKTVVFAFPELVKTSPQNHVQNQSKTTAKTRFEFPRRPRSLIVHDGLVGYYHLRRDGTYITQYHEYLIVESCARASISTSLEKKKIDRL